jgi:hypothetical protein
MELCHGKSLPSHWEEADGWQQCIPCKQYNEASLFAEFAKSSFLG